MVDDEPNMRSTVSELLMDDGYTVDLAESGEQAVEMLKRARVDVVVLPWVLIDTYMKGYDKPYFDRTAAWVDLSMYISHRLDDSDLTEDLRKAIRKCRFIAEQNQGSWDIPVRRQDLKN